MVGSGKPASSEAATRVVQRGLPPLASGQRVLVAYSGGLDSTVLLHALLRAKVAGVEAVHVHHGLQDVAEQWVAHCERTCRAWGVPFHLQRVTVIEAEQGLEAAAREARYRALRAAMRPGDVVALAHHRDDQAETVLLRLLRGTGLNGIAAMRPLLPFAPGRLWRPWLDTPRSVLQAHALRHKLQWIEDPQNQGSEFARSFLRSEILPRLVQHWPAASRNLARAAELAAESSELLREVATDDLDEIGEPDGPLPIPALRALTPARRHNLLRAWIEGLGVPLPFRDTLLRLEREVFDAAEDADPVLAWPGGEFRRYRDRLFAMAPLPPPPGKFLSAWDGRGELPLPAGCGALWSPAGRRRPLPCTVRLARPSDRFRPFASSATRTLKNLFQERGVPTWVRARTPLVLRENQIVWVGGIGWAADRDWVALRSEIEWRQRPVGARLDS